MTERNNDKESYRISIHALLAESDWSSVKLAITAADISIHALLAESDQMIEEERRVSD